MTTPDADAPIDPTPAIREFFGLLWRYFHARVDLDVDDLVQQTLAEYFAAARRAGPIVHPKAYVLRIARSVLFEHYRRRTHFDPLTHRLADVAAGLSSRMNAHQRADRVRTAMMQLPYALFETIDLYYGEGLRGPVLAATLGVPEGTIRSRLRRAKAQLRAAYAEVRAADDPHVSSCTE